MTARVFGKHWSLFRLLGFEVRLDASWLILALLVTWSLATGLFPEYYPDLAARTYWSMGIAGMIGLVFSIVFHELSHSLIARLHGLPITGITLFIFGGVAEMAEEPRSARVEFQVAIAGPIASALLAGSFLVLASLLAWMGASAPLQGVAYYLSAINAMLAVFNLLPAFPLDGGRMFRAALWYWKGNLAWATRRAAGAGEILGFALLFLGILNIVSGNIIGGIWWFLIGLFLRQAAGDSYRETLIRRVFEGEPLGRFMTRDPISVPLGITVRDFVDDYLYRYHHDLFPVTDRGRLVGYVRAHDVKNLSDKTWDNHALSEIVRPCSPDNTVAPGLDSLRALAQMRRTGNSRLMVVDQDRLVGVLVLKDMLELFALKMDLEGLD